MAKNSYVAGLDIGSSKICAAVGSVAPDGRAEIAGIGVAPSRGLAEGAVTDLALASKSIDEAVSAAEEKSGIPIYRVIAGFDSPQIKTIRSAGTVTVADKESEITHRDANRAIASARGIALPLERQIIHVENLGYRIDGQGGIREPVGLFGTKLGVELNLVTAPHGLIQNVLKSANGAGLEVDGISPSGAAVALAVLTPEEKERGVTLLDIGSGLTDISFFSEGVMRGLQTLALGTRQISEEIAASLKIPQDDADEIMRNYAFFPGGPVELSEKIDVKSDYGYKSVSRGELCVLAEAKAKEIFQAIKKELAVFEPEQWPRCIVMTGGMSLFEGAVELCQSYFGVPVRLGYSRDVLGSLRNITNPTYAAAVGLLRFGAQRRKTVDAGRLNFLSRALLRAKELYSEYF